MVELKFTTEKEHILNILSRKEREDFINWACVQEIDLPYINNKVFINYIKEWLLINEKLKLYKKKETL